MLWALLMLRRFVRVVALARREEDFLPVLGAGVFLVLVGTVTYAVGEDWSVVDAFYFSVSTLTTTSVADPGLVLEHQWMKLFTVFYLLVGIGILVELLRRFGNAYVTIRAQERRRPQLGSAREDRSTREPPD